MCVVRNFDNTAGIEKCTEAFEYLSAVPHDPTAGKLTQGGPVTTAGIELGY
jgi:hypothetical protein